MKTDVQPQITILKYSKLGKSSSIFGTLFLKKKRTKVRQTNFISSTKTTLSCIVFEMTVMFLVHILDVDISIYIGKFLLGWKIK